MNKYLVKVDPDGAEILEIPPIHADSLAEATAEFIARYPGPSTYTYTIEIIPPRDERCISFNLRYVGFTTTSYTTVEANPLVILRSPSDYGFPEYTTMSFRLMFTAYNNGVAHGFIRLATDNNGTGTYASVANTEVEVTSGTKTEYTSGTDLMLTPGNIYFVQGKSGNALQVTWILHACLVITFS